MESLVKCARCKKKPRVKAGAERKGWDGQSTEHEPDPSGMNLRPAKPKSPTKSASPKKAAGTPSPKKGDSVFDRLTDSKKYTGAHKHRFDESGKGRGKDGRDVIAKGRAHVPSMGVSNQASASPSSKKSASASAASPSNASADSPKDEPEASAEATADASAEATADASAEATAEDGADASGDGAAPE